MPGMSTGLSTNNPVIVSAFGPRALRLAGEVGDGWLSFSHTPESYRSVMRGPIAEAAKRAGRTLQGFETSLVLPIGVSKDRAKLTKVIGGIAKDWMVWSPDNMRLVAPELEPPGVRQPYAKRNEGAAVDALRRVSRQIPDEIAMRTAIAGSPSECIEQLAAFSRAGLRRAILYIVAVDQSSSSRQAARTVARQVLPHFSPASSR